VDLRRISKFLVAAATAVVIAAQAPATDGRITTGEWLAIALAVIGSGAVWAVPNAQAPSSPVGRHEKAPTRDPEEAV
jgi:hypothetical protein